MSEVQERRILKIVKGYELNSSVPESIEHAFCKYSFMKPAYQKATRAVLEIVRQTKRFHKEMEKSTSDLSRVLFPYSSNVIVFTAPRGGGKTRTMRTFASALAEKPSNWTAFTCPCAECRKDNKAYLPDEDLTPMQDCRFILLSPPVEPSVLNQDQSILNVILSRLYNYAVNMLESIQCQRSMTDAAMRCLSRKFEECRSGIKGVQGQKELEDLEDFQNLRKSINLRELFYELVQELLKLATNGQATKNSFLILQLDDADSQIKSGFSVLEEVRKYLIIPNLIIFTSAEIDMLYNVIQQSQLKEFTELRQLKTDTDNDFVKDITRISRKYIDKLIPPSHMVVLPTLKDFSTEKVVRLDLQYIDPDQNGDERKIMPWIQENDLNFQQAILSLIYRKTGMVFVEPEGYMHNIIPRTLRGLNQMLYVLREMKDIPWAHPEQCATQVEFLHMLMGELQQRQENLRLFADYFGYDWISAKVTKHEDLDFLKNLFATALRNRVSMAYHYLQRKHPSQNESKQLPVTRYMLDALMSEQDALYRTEDDFLLRFTIRTILTLASHREAVNLQWAIVSKFVSANDEHYVRTRPLIFDFDPELLGMPRTYVLNKQVSNQILGEYQPAPEVLIEAARYYKGTPSVRAALLQRYDLQPDTPTDWARNFLDFFNEKLRKAVALEDSIPEDLSFEQTEDTDNVLVENNALYDSALWTQSNEYPQPVRLVTKNLTKIPLLMKWHTLCAEQSDKRHENLLRFLGQQILEPADNPFQLQVHFLNFVGLPLRFGNEVFSFMHQKTLIHSKKLPQREVFYDCQMSALLIALNADVQLYLYKHLNVKTELGGSWQDAIYRIIDQVDQCLTQLLDGKVSAKYAPISLHFETIFNANGLNEELGKMCNAMFSTTKYASKPNKNTDSLGQLELEYTQLQKKLMRLNREKHLLEQNARSLARQKKLAPELQAKLEQLISTAVQQATRDQPSPIKPDTPPSNTSSNDNK